MNESAYMKALWQRIGTGKIGNQGQGYLDTGWLDSAFGGADARRNLTLQKIGDSMTNTQNALDLAKKNTNYAAQRYATNYGLRKDAIDAESRDALTGDIITGASLPIAYIEGQNERRAIEEDRARQDRLNRSYEALLGRLS